MAPLGTLGRLGEKLPCNLCRLLGGSALESIIPGFTTPVTHTGMVPVGEATLSPLALQSSQSRTRVNRQPPDEAVGRSKKSILLTGVQIPEAWNVMANLEM